jgi:hypothetical protein
MGIFMTGATLTSANSSYIARELWYQVKDSGAVRVLCVEKILEITVAGATLGGLGPDRVFVF